MILKIKNTKEQTRLNLPAHEGDVGYDLTAISEPNIVGKQNSLTGFWEEISYIEYDTNIAIQFEDIETGMDTTGYITINRANEFYTNVYPRSSISKTNLILANSIGLIDAGYQNTIKLRFKYIAQPKDLIIGVAGQIDCKIDESKIYHKGDKISQLVFGRQIHPNEIVYVDNFEESERGLGGFGSTGK